MDSRVYITIREIRSPIGNLFRGYRMIASYDNHPNMDNRLCWDGDYIDIHGDDIDRFIKNLMDFPYHITKYTWTFQPGECND